MKFDNLEEEVQMQILNGESLFVTRTQILFDVIPRDYYHAILFFINALHLIIHVV